MGLQTGQLGQGGTATGSGDRGQRGAWQFTNGSLQTARGSLQTWQFTNVPVCKRGSLQTWQFTNGAWQFTNVAVYKRRVAVYKRRVAVYKRGSLQTWLVLPPSMAVVYHESPAGGGASWHNHYLS